MRRMSWFLVGLGLSALAFGQSAPRVEISPTIGYLFGGNLWDPNDGARPSRSATTSTTACASAGSRRRDGSSSSTGRAFPRGSSFRRSLPSISLDIDYVTPRVAYHFATGALRPYVAAGLGIGFFDTADSVSKGYFTGTLAIGLKAFLTPGLGARIEARGFASGVGDPPLGFPCTEFAPGDGGVEPVSCAHEWSLNGDLTAGIVVAF